MTQMKTKDEGVTVLNLTNKTAYIEPIFAE